MFQEIKQINGQSSICKATLENQQQIAPFLKQNNYLHRHLDWFDTLDWLGDQPFLIERIGHQIQALLCATPENEQSAWVRTFSANKQIPVEESWQRLLSIAVKSLRGMGVSHFAALALHDWFERLLKLSDFHNRQNIIVLEWQGKFPAKDNNNTQIKIRPMYSDDLGDVYHLDKLAFPPLWQNSSEGLSKAFNQPGIATVAIFNDEIIGYQISTTMTIYGHLARLAIHPTYQRQGVAFMLLNDLLKQFERLGFWRITVNTQSDNKPSRQLYEKFGFIQTREEIPVYEMNL